MALADEIKRLRDESLASLDASHNYYIHTKQAWRLVQELVRQGHEVRIENQATGNIVDGTELSALARNYVADYLASATFQDFVSQFERFVFDVIRAWLTEYPGSLAGKQLEFRTVINATDKDAIVTAVVQKEVLGVAYQKVADWFGYLERIAQLGVPSPEAIARVAEMKASRDVLVHNNGIANSLYIQKAMSRARFRVGDKLELPEHYHRESWELLKQIVTDIADAGVDKLSG